MPTAKVRLRSRRNILDTETASIGGIVGRTTSCQTSAASPTGTVTRKAPRHPISSPRKLPSGAAMTIANAVPPWSKAMALGRSDPEARRARMAVESDQKPPIAMPTSARPARKTRKLGARATARLEAVSTAV